MIVVNIIVASIPLLVTIIDQIYIRYNYNIYIYINDFLKLCMNISINFVLMTF